MRQVLAVVGPTASGKTALGITIAERLETEILSADSMQFYRGMAIGTGAPTPEEQARVKHHFVGFLEPNETFSAGQFEQEARAVVERLNARGKTAVVVGGSGLYISALIDGLFRGPGKDQSVRARLHEEAEDGGVEALYKRLETVDPAYARQIHPNDLRRIVRALEVYELTGSALSRLHAAHRDEEQPLDAVQAAPDLPRETLYERINARVNRMIEEGLIEEVRALLEKGYGDDIERLRSLGYREIAAYVCGECSIEEAVEAMKQNTRRYAKRQLTWFRGDPRVHWLTVDESKTVGGLADEALALL